MTAIITNHIVTYNALVGGDYHDFCRITGQLIDNYTLINYQGIMGETKAFILANEEIHECRDDGTTDLTISKEVYQKWQKNRHIVVPFSRLHDIDQQALHANIRYAMSSNFKEQSFETWKFKKGKKSIRITWNGAKYRVHEYDKAMVFYTNYSKIIGVMWRK